MIKSITLALALTHFLLLPSAIAGTDFYKCKVDGSVHYQQVPCPSNEISRSPTVEELNAGRQKQLLPEKEKPKGPPLQARPMALPETPVIGRRTAFALIRGLPEVAEPNGSGYASHPFVHLLS